MIRNLKMLTINRQSRKSTQLFSALLVKFRESRGTEHHVNFNIMIKVCCVVAIEIKNDQRKVLEKIQDNDI